MAAYSPVGRCADDHRRRCAFSDTAAVAAATPPAFDEAPIRVVVLPPSPPPAPPPPSPLPSPPARAAAAATSELSTAAAAAAEAVAAATAAAVANSAAPDTAAAVAALAKGRAPAARQAELAAVLVDGARPTHCVLKMWGANGNGQWRRNGKKDTCWGSGSQFWDDALAGKNCRAWDWGGRFDAPSVFGLPNDGGDHEVFKNMPMCRNAECTMERFCLDHAGLAANRFGRRRLSESNATTPRAAGGRTCGRRACRRAQHPADRRLDHVPNFEWMMCALKGRLAPNPTRCARHLLQHRAEGHGRRAAEEGHLLPLLRRLRRVRHLLPRGVHAQRVCRNQNDLFVVDRGEAFVCDFDEAAFRKVERDLTHM